ncbi:MAG: PcfJ domain-containing protein [Sporomusaceae bacterium]|nr:PcfJ domain-containing protein [Sporomusaceae bacterium]
MEINEILEHFPDDRSDEIKQYATDSVFRWSRYLFTRREGKRQYAYCTHCRKETANTKLRHNSQAKCPHCGSTCIVKAAGIGRKRLLDEGYFVYYEKSTYDPEAIIARGIYAVRDYRGDYRQVKTIYLTKAFYLFRPGQAHMLCHKHGYYVTWDGRPRMEKGSLSQCKSVYSLFTPITANGWGGSNDVVISYSRNSIAAAVAGTQFRFSTWEQYDHGDMVKFFALYAKYPCVEYLTKMGFSHLVETKLEGGNTFGCINWRGKTVMKVLRLSKKDLRELKAADIHVDPSFLRYLQVSRKDGSNLSFTEIKQVDNAIGWCYSDLQKILKQTTLRRAWTYISKQFPLLRPDKKQAFYSEQAVLHSWRDYLADCVKLDLELTNERTLFPRNLYRAHQNTIKQVQHQADELLAQKLVAKVAELQKYCFEKSGLFIRPAADQKELIAEGKSLEHCVGGYARAYAEGRSIILLIRNKKQPDKPFFTMEIHKGYNGKMMITQCRGLRNCDPDARVKKFVDAFTAARMQPENEVRVRVTVPA